MADRIAQKVASKSMWQAVPPRRFRELSDGLLGQSRDEWGPAAVHRHVTLHLVADPVLTTDKSMICSWRWLISPATTISTNRNVSRNLGISLAHYREPQGLR